MMLKSELIKDYQATDEVARFDLVVVGGGYAGLNALYAAAYYLPRGAKVLLLDNRDTIGGMWNNVYDYVRLHQAHSVFTVGDIKWNWSKPARYRATGEEVLAHLARTIGPISKRVDLNMRFGQTVVSCEEIAINNEYCAEVIFHPNDEPQKTTRVLASRAINAPGQGTRMQAALALSSDAVLSTTPQELISCLDEHPDSPVYVVGGGKTGMDTVSIVLSKYPNRKIVLLNGRGTNFVNRDQILPVGLDRWTSGTPISNVLGDLALAFDGDNEDAVMERFRRLHSTNPESKNQNMQFGFQSMEEHQLVKSGVTQTLQSHLEDVIDTSTGACMQLRDGTSELIADGAIVVNCTGTMFVGDDYQPMIKCLSPNDTVLNINLRDAWVMLSGISAFFMTHLLYRNVLRGNGFYTLDHEIVFRSCRKTWMCAASAQAYQNQCIALQTLPLMLLNKCGLDMDRWYPFPRRLVNIIKMRHFSGDEITHCRRVLDHVANRFDVHCAPIE